MKTVVTKEIFECAKILFKSGAKNQEVCRYLKLAPCTVTRIKQAETLEEYKQIQAAAVANWKGNQKKKEANETPKPETDEVQRKPENAKPTNNLAGQYQMNRIIDLLREQNEIMKLLSNKLAFIVEQLS